MIQCSFYECFISLVKTVFLFTWAYVHVLSDTVTHLQCLHMKCLIHHKHLSLSLSEWSDVSWVQREWLSKYCIYSRLWDGVSPVCFSCCLPLRSSPFTQCSLSCGTLTHTQAPADILFSYSYSDKHQRADSPPHLCQKQHTESSQLIWGSRRAVSVNHGIIPCHTNSCHTNTMVWQETETIPLDYYSSKSLDVQWLVGKYCGRGRLQWPYEMLIPWYFKIQYTMVLISTYCSIYIWQMLLSEMTEKQCNFDPFICSWHSALQMFKKNDTTTVDIIRIKIIKHGLLKKFIICKTKWKQKMVLSKYVHNSINIVYALVRIV